MCACVWVCDHVCVLCMCSHGDQKVLEILKLELQAFVRHQCRYREMNSVPLEEKQVLLTAEPPCKACVPHKFLQVDISDEASSQYKVEVSTSCDQCAVCSAMDESRKQMG